MKKFLILNEATGLYHNTMYGWVSKDRATVYKKRPVLGLSVEKLTVVNK